jgi:excisionase family DNA binding protein
LWGKETSEVDTALSKDLVYLTPAQVANWLQVHPRTVQRWTLTDPTCPAIRLGTKVIRFERQALEHWLARKLPRKAQHASLVLSQPAKSA